MKDINFNFENNRFNFRVGAYICCNGKMLLQTSPQFSFWNLVGGRVKMGESTLDAIKRELNEELGITKCNPHLIKVAETFFDWQGVSVQELFFVYQVDLPKSYYKKLDNFLVLDSDGEHTNWFDEHKLKQIVCKPEFIYELPKSKTLTHQILKNK